MVVTFLICYLCSVTFLSCYLLCDHSTRRPVYTLTMPPTEVLMNLGLRRLSRPWGTNRDRCWHQPGQIHDHIVSQHATVCGGLLSDPQAFFSSSTIMSVLRVRRHRPVGRRTHHKSSHELAIGTVLIWTTLKSSEERIVAMLNRNQPKNTRSYSSRSSSTGTISPGT